tara:strand:+ start:438 stop:659 length:222 start_codon:yes stop_codon:yes gene_type:complete
MIVTISGCSDALTSKLSTYLKKNNIWHFISAHDDGAQIDFNETKELISKETFMEWLAGSGLSDADKQCELMEF